jgi:hypothetical protein
VGVFQEFIHRGRYFLAGLRKNRYYSVKDFEMIRGHRWEAYRHSNDTGEPIEEILDCDKTLVDSNRKGRFRVRAILQREVGSKAFSVVVTNIPRKEEPDATKIADTYRAQRDQRQAAFRQMKPSLYPDIDTPYPPGLTTHQSKATGPRRKPGDTRETDDLYGTGSPKDHIMTILEMALNNAHIFVKENYLPEQYRGLDFTTTRDVLYKQGGTFLEKKKEIKITLAHYDEQPDHQMLAEYATQRVNDARLFTANGKRIIMQVAKL